MYIISLIIYTLHIICYRSQIKQTVTDQLLLNFFHQYGEVIDSVVLSERKTKRSRGFGFVTFADPVSYIIRIFLIN